MADGLTSIDLRQKRAKLVNDARVYFDIESVKGEPSAESLARIDAMHAEVDRLTSAIERAERQETLESGLQNSIGAPSASGLSGASNEEAAKEKARLEARAWNQYLRGGMASLSAEERVVALPRFQNAQGTGSGAAGGYTVPEGFYNELISAQLAYGGMLEAGFILNTDSGNALPIPTENDTGNTGSILSENTQASAQDVVFGAVTLNAYTYTSKIILVANQLLQDTGVNLNALLQMKMAERIARAVNAHFTTGTGASQPTGITVAGTSGVTAAAAAALTWDEVAIDLVHSVDPSYRRNGRFMLADSTLKALKKLKDGDGNYLWRPGLVMGDPDTIAGYQYIVNQDMPAMTTGLKPVAFGDFSKYFMRRVNGVQVLRLTERYADYNQTAFLAFQRWDGQLVDAGTHPVKYITMA